MATASAILLTFLTLGAVAFFWAKRRSDRLKAKQWDNCWLNVKEDEPREEARVGFLL